MSDRDQRNYNRNARSNPSRFNKSKSGSYHNRGSRNQMRNRPYIRKGNPVYLLDILQHGGVDKAKHSWDPIAQIITMSDFKLYEVTLNKNKYNNKY